MFKPTFTIIPQISLILAKLEGLRVQIDTLPITPYVLASLRESSQLSSVHYSTMIEGNKLTQEEVASTLENKKPLPGRERDQWEVLGYYQALDYVNKLAQKSATVSQEEIKKIHALVMGKGHKNIKPTPYRDVQNVIKDSATRSIVYLPPEARDVPKLMQELTTGINENAHTIPVPLLSAIAHYQYATIHPYIDGNGRTARLLTTLILHLGGYGLKGIYSLDEYYAKNLAAYYQGLNVGSSHNYYMGREEADITSWIEYFCKGLLESFEKTLKHASVKKNHESEDQSGLLQEIDAKQRLAVSALFVKHGIIKTDDIQKLFKVHPITARTLCKKWVEEGFLVVVDTSKRNRTYSLSKRYKPLVAQKAI
jgi:Fic family protein